MRLLLDTHALLWALEDDLRRDARVVALAHLIGASPALVRAWEQGGRVPSPMARRLLDAIRREGRPWRAMVRRAG